MRKIIEFESMGNNYRCRQFSAAMGVALSCSPNETHPLEMLSLSEVLTDEGWVPLSSAAAINRYVLDSLGFVAPSAVLETLCGKVYLLNFGFLKDWKPIDIPRRLIAKIDASESPRMDPVMCIVLMTDKATLKELEEYYSTEDLFDMYDMIAVDNLNKALGSEAAAKEAKRNSR